MRSAFAPRSFLPLTVTSLSLALALGLSGCATPGAPPPGGQSAMIPAASGLRARDAADEDVSSYGLFLAGAAALDDGASDDAAGLLSRASASAPEDAGLRERAFTANLLAGRVSEAAALAPLQDAPTAGTAGPAASTPPTPGAKPAAEAKVSNLVSLGRLVLAVDHLAAGRGQAAADLLAPGVIGPPHTAAAALLRPWALAQAGDAPNAKPAAATLEKLDDDEASLGRARLLERAGQFGKAASAYKALVTNGAAGAVFDEGAFLERRGQGDAAKALYEASLAKAPGDPGLIAARARVIAKGPPPALPSIGEGAAEALIAPAATFVAHRQPEFGVIYLRLALRLDPRFSQAWLLVGDSLAAGGDQAGAAEAYGHITPDQREYPTSLGRLALRLQADGDKGKALALAKDAAARAPDDLAVQVLYAEILRDDQRFDESIPVLDRAITAHGEEGEVGARLHFMRGVALERAGRWPQAEVDLKRAVAMRPDDPEMLNYLGFAWADRGEHLTEALALLQKASAAAPEDGAILDSVGWARFRLGDTRGAIRDLERAVALTPADAEVNDHLGDAYQRVGRKVEARYQWRRVLTLEPTDAQRTSVSVKLKAVEAGDSAPRVAVAPAAAAS